MSPSDPEERNTKLVPVPETQQASRLLTKVDRCAILYVQVYFCGRSPMFTLLYPAFRVIHGHPISPRVRRSHLRIPLPPILPRVRGRRPPFFAFFADFPPPQTGRKAACQSPLAFSWVASPVPSRSFIRFFRFFRTIFSNKPSMP